DRQVQRGAPRREHRGAYERSDARAERDVTVDARDEPASERGSRAGLAERLAGDTGRALERQGALRPIGPQFAVPALREEVVGRRDGHVKAFAPLRAAPRPPPGEQLRLVARLRA